MININDIVNQMNRAQPDPNFNQKVGRFRGELEKRVKGQSPDAEFTYTQPAVRQFQSDSGFNPLVDVTIYNPLTQLESLYCIGIYPEGDYGWVNVKH